MSLESKQDALKSKCPHLHALYSQAPTPSPWKSNWLRRAALSLISRNPAPNTGVPEVSYDEAADSFANLKWIRELGPDRFFYALAEKTKSPLIKVKVGTHWVYLVTEAEVSKQLLANKDASIGRGRGLEPFKEMVGDIFFVQDGPSVAEGRSRFRASVNRFQKNFNRLEALNAQEVARLSRLKPGESFDLSAFVFAYVVNCIAKCFIGINDTSTIPLEAHQIFLDAAAQIVDSGSNPLSRIFGFGYRKKFKETKQKMRQLCEDLIAKNIESICDGDNYVWDLAVARASQLNPGSDFSKICYYAPENPASKVIRDLILHDDWVREHGPTTAFASLNLGRTLLYLLDVLKQRPDIVTQIQVEIDNVVGNSSFSVKDMNRLPYLHAVINEALRQLTPIPSFPREVVKDFEIVLGDTLVKMKRGNTIIFLFHRIQGSVREFSPEFWLSDSAQRQNHWAFGAAHRRCPAEAFVFQTCKQFLVSLVQAGLQICPTVPLRYTTRMNGLGPDYDSKSVIAGELVNWAKKPA